MQIAGVCEQGVASAKNTADTQFEQQPPNLRATAYSPLVTNNLANSQCENGQIIQSGGCNNQTNSHTPLNQPPN